MGFTLYATNSNRSFDGGMGGFMNLRINIAKAWDKEFGEHYSSLSPCFSKEQYEAFDEKTNEILSDSRFKDEDQDIVDFLFASEYEGYITHKTCKKIYDLIKDINFGNAMFTYIYHSDGKDYEHFKEFLLECYKHRRYMRWH